MSEAEEGPSLPVLTITRNPGARGFLMKHSPKTSGLSETCHIVNECYIY